jgi:hypothetical protein
MHVGGAFVRGADAMSLLRHAALARRECRKSDTGFAREVTMTDVVSAAGSLSAALVSGKMTESQLRWSRRHASGTALIHSLLPISRLLQQWDIATDTATWATAVINCMTTVQVERSAMPRQWVHLESSLRAALGEANGLGHADRISVDDCREFFNPDRLWIDFAADYLSLVLAGVGYWREESSTRRAGRVRIPSFDRWLQETGRYFPGLGTWPSAEALRKHRVGRSILP